VNERHEVVGLMSVGAQALPDKTKVASAVAAAALKAAMVKSGITFVAPPAPTVSLANFNPLQTLIFLDSTAEMVHTVVIAPVKQFLPPAPPGGEMLMPAGGPFGAAPGGVPGTDAPPQNHTDGPGYRDPRGS
jgi:hypothetical protein